ncbi:MAG: PQQ-like beta-propeller repeat protein, partial [Armatimonadetes bacterium]|nr:PQQ-like beta-propeller repeat protein [Armatimonadota bacterium]
GQGRATLRVTWPSAEHPPPARGKFMPSTTQSIKIRLLRASAVVHEDVVMNANGPSQVDIGNIPVGEVQFEATAYPEYGAAGNPLARGSQTAQIEPNDITSVTIDLTSTIASFRLSYPAPFWVGQQDPLVVEAVDSAGNMVMSPGFLFQSNHPSLLEVNSDDGWATGLAAGQATITIREQDTLETATFDVPVQAILPGRGLWFSMQQGYLNGSCMGNRGPTAGDALWQLPESEIRLGYRATPVLGQELVYVVGQDQRDRDTQGAQCLFALDPANGRIIWAAPYESFNTPAVGRNGTIYLTTYDTLLAIDPNRPRQPLWSYPGLTNAHSPLVGDDNRIYVQDDLNLHVVSPEGERVWMHSAAFPSYSLDHGQPAVHPVDDRVYAVDGGDLVALLRTTGQEVWRYAFRRNHTYSNGNTYELYDFAPTSSPAIASLGDGGIYIAAQYKLYKLNSDGTLAWRYPADDLSDIDNPVVKFFGELPGFNGGIYSNLAVSTDGTQVAAVAVSGYLAVLAADGTLRWDTVMAAAVQSDGPAIQADGTVYVADDSNALHCYGPAGGETFRVQMHNLIGIPAVDSQGTMFVCGGSLLALAGEAD